GDRMMTLFAATCALSTPVRCSARSDCVDASARPFERQPMHRRKQYGHGFGEACSHTIDEEVAPNLEEYAQLAMIVETRAGAGFAEIALHGNHRKDGIHFRQARHCRVDRRPDAVPHWRYRALWPRGGEPTPAWL